MVRPRSRMGVETSCASRNVASTAMAAAPRASRLPGPLPRALVLAPLGVRLRRLRPPPHARGRRGRSPGAAEGLDTTPEPPRDKRYILEMLPYPSGDIHIGHFRNYTIGDVVARFERMRGHDVLHPFGWDAFGLPAENAAIKHGIHPGQWTYKNIETSRCTLRKMGLSYDWEREVVTCRADYDKVTHRMCLLLHSRGFAYRARAAV